MSEFITTVIGNVVNDVRSSVTKTGTEVCSFRLASTPRRYDRGIGQWVDGDTSFVNVTCWRRLARHVRESVHRGDPVLVHGRLRVREYETEDGRKGTSVEVDAVSVGHDMSRGTSQFVRPQRERELAPGPERDHLDAAAPGWDAEPVESTPEAASEAVGGEATAEEGEIAA